MRTPTRSGTSKIAYGDDPSQYGVLHVPRGEPRGIVVVIHGGFWKATYDYTLGEPLAQDLARRGWIAWNIEYRRLGNGGGNPETFADICAAIDHLAQLGLPHGRTITLGHSAGDEVLRQIGPRLSQILRDDKRLGPYRMLDIARQVASARSPRSTSRARTSTIASRGAGRALATADVISIRMAKNSITQASRKSPNITPGEAFAWSLAIIPMSTAPTSRKGSIQISVAAK